jgi:hypothetical protein
MRKLREKLALEVVVWGRGYAPFKRGIAPLPHQSGNPPVMPQ